MNTKRRRLAWLAAILSLTIFAAACGSDDNASTGDTTDTTEGDGGNVPDVSGDVVISGSSTVAPISSRVGELLEDAGSGIAADVDNPGTGDGFKLFCAGEIDIADASRPIKDTPEELGKCTDSGIEFIELKIAFDGLSVLVNPANDAVECLSFPDLYALVGPESTAKTWRDAATLAAELGSKTVFPDLDLEITAPGEESGTYDSFAEIALQKIGEARSAEGKLPSKDDAKTTRKDYSSQADDSAIITGIEGPDGGFGWVGFAVAEEAGDAVREVAVAKEAGGECVAPSAETIADGSYPMSRSLYIYVNKAKLEANEAIGGYVDYYLGDGYGAVEEIGYIALPDDQLAETVARWEARTVGTAAG